jgi:hypothetical protein
MHAARSDASSHLLSPPSWPASQLSPLLQPCFACNRTVQQQDNWYSAWRTLLTPLLTATDEKRKKSRNPKSYPPRQDESERRGRRLHEWMKQARVVFVLSSTVCSITGSAKIDQGFVGRNDRFPMCQSPEFFLYLSSESSWRFLTSFLPISETLWCQDWALEEREGCNTALHTFLSFANFEWWFQCRYK